MSAYVLSIVVEGQDKASGPLSGIAGVLGKMGTIAGGILTADIFRGLGNGLANFGSQAFSATAQMQSFEMGLQTLVARELATASATTSLNEAFSKAGPLAKSIADNLKDIAIESPYLLSTVQDTFRMAMAFGFGADEAEKFSKAVLNMGAGVNASDEMLGRMAYNLAQIRLQGKVTAVDIRQLALAGLDLNAALKDIGAQFGVTVNNHEDFNRAIASGKIKWEDFAGAFEKYADKNFGGAAERMSHTLQGLQSTFSELFLITMPTVLGPAAEAARGFLEGVLMDFQAFTDSGVLEAWGASLGKSADWAVGKLEYLYNFFSSFGFDGLFHGATLKPMLENVFGVDSGMLDGFLSAFAPITDALSGVMADMGPTISLALKGVVTGLADLATFANEQGPALVAIFSNMFGGIIELGGQLAGQVIPWMVSSFQMVTGWIAANGPLITAFTDLMATSFQNFVGILTGAWAWIEPLLSGLITLILDLATFWMQVFTGDMPGALLTLQATAAGIFTAIGSTVMAFLNWIASWFGTSLAQISAIWRGNWNLLVTIVQTQATMIGTTIATMAQNAIRAINDMVMGMVGNVLNGAVRFYRAGASIMDGLFSGIKSKVAEIIAYVKRIAADIASAFANAMKIKSPSRVFFGFGENIVDGLALGMTSTNSAFQASDAQAQRVMSPFAGASGAASVPVSGPITINVDGTGDPEAVAKKLYRLIKAQGVVA